jgi:hypothetical protein
MEKEFVPYELAVKLKALGFDEPCFGYYDTDGLQVSTHYWYPENKNTSFPESQTTNNPKISAPTFSQAFRWFRERYNAVCEIIRREDKNHSTFMGWVYIDIRKFEAVSYWEFKTYEEAELACLDKLIEIVEQNQQ